MDTGGWDGAFDEMDPGDTGWSDPPAEFDAGLPIPDDGLPIADDGLPLSDDGPPLPDAGPPDFPGLDPAYDHQYDFGDLGEGVSEPVDPDDGFEPLDGDYPHDLMGEVDQPMLDPETPETSETPHAPEMPVVGTDPDLALPSDDGQWLESIFPPALDLVDPPVPFDGFPWADPAILGSLDGASGVGADGYGLPPDTWLTTTPGELAAFDAGYDGLGAAGGSDWAASGASWATLATSDDPATSCLARWWATPA